MQDISKPAYWEVVNHSLWKQQNIVEFINEIIGDLYIGEDPDDLKRAEVRLIAIDTLLDGLKKELNHIIPLVQRERDALF